MSKTEDKYTSFFEEIKKFKEKQQQQKQRGLNDFNLLSTVRNYHDEVYLHSTMIGALLDPKGLHYQDTLFVENFLDVLKLKDFELELNNITVLVEYHDIDLYITDSNKHIIIENKIWAADQPCQIIKYINIIKEENDLYVDDDKKIEDIYVLYLTPDDTKKVSFEHVIRNKYISFKIDGNDKLDECSKRENTKNLVPNGLKNYQVKYKKINYKDDILNWLRLCLEEVQNITNLNESVKQYISVVEMVNNNYKGKIMSLSEKLEDEENFAIAYDVYKVFNETCAVKEKEFWNTLMGKVSNISGYIGIENKRDGKIQQELLDEKVVMRARLSKGNSSQINIHFNVKDNIRLMLGSDNRSDEVYLVIYKKDWISIDKTTVEDNNIIETINKIDGYTFKQKRWCYGESILKNTISLRNEKLINSLSKVDNIASEIEELVENLRTQNDPI